MSACDLANNTSTRPLIRPAANSMRVTLCCLYPVESDSLPDNAAVPDRHGDACGTDGASGASGRDELMPSAYGRAPRSTPCAASKIIRRFGCHNDQTDEVSSLAGKPHTPAPSTSSASLGTGGCPSLPGAGQDRARGG